MPSLPLIPEALNGQKPYYRHFLAVHVSFISSRFIFLSVTVWPDGLRPPMPALKFSKNISLHNLFTFKHVKEFPKDSNTYLLQQHRMQLLPNSTRKSLFDIKARWYIGSIMQTKNFSFKKSGLVKRIIRNNKLRQKFENIRRDWPLLLNINSEISNKAFISPVLALVVAC